MAENATIGALRVLLGLDSAQFEKGLKGAQDKLKGFHGNVVKLDFAKGLHKGLEGVNEKLHEFSGRLGVAGGAMSAIGGPGLAAAAALGALAEALHETREALKFADEIGAKAKKFKQSTDAVQELEFAVHRLGGTFQDADGALEGFQLAFGAALDGINKRSLKPFQALRLDPKDFADTEEAFDAVIDKISKVSNAAQQADLAQKLGLGSILPAIRAGADRLNELREAAHAAGDVMDAELVEKGEALNKQYEELARKVDVEFKSAFIGLGPELIYITGLMADLATATDDFVNSFKRIENRSTSSIQRGVADAIHQIKEDSKIPLIGGLLQKDDFDRMSRLLDELQKRSQEREPAEVGTGRDPGVRNLAEEAAAEKARAAAASAANAAAAKQRASDEAVRAATSAELNARLALIGDIDALAAFKREQIDTETKLANNLLEEDAARGKLSAAAAAAAILLNNRAAVEKKALVDREQEAAADVRRLDQVDVLNGYYDRIAGVAAETAGTAEAAGAVERAALLRRQGAEADHARTDVLRKVLNSEITDAEGVVRLATLTEAQAAERIAQDVKAREAAEHERARRAQDALELQIDELSAQAGLLRSQFARGAVELKILALKQELERQALEEVSRTAKAGSPEKIAADKRLKGLDSLQAAETAAAKADHRLVDAMGEASDAISAIASAFKSHDWARLTNALQAEIETIQASFANFGPAGGLATLGSAAGQIIGGRTGRAIGGGLGIAASGIGLGASLGSAASLGLFGGASGAILGASTFLGPVAIAAGAAYALYELLKGRPTNAGAGVALSPTQVLGLSGQRRTRETEAAATGAANAILQGEATLKAAGITLGSTVTGLVIGTRDLSQIYLSNGRTLTAAVGDAAAATDTALKALLDGATYASEAQKSLVTSMLAAGKGFDDIAASLDAYAQAQGLQQQIADAVLALIDPQAAAQVQLQREQADRRKQVQAALDAGYITAAQFAALSEQLGRLEGLELDDVLKRFAGAVDSAADAARKMADDARSFAEATFKVASDRRDLMIQLLNARGDTAGATALSRQAQREGTDPFNRDLLDQLFAEQDYQARVSGARQSLTEAYEREKSALEAVQQKFQGFFDSLKSYADELSQTAAATLDPQTRTARARARFRANQALVATGDQGALAQVEALGRELVGASEKSSTRLQYLRDIAEVRRAVGAGERYAKDQVQLAAEQIDHLGQVVNGLLGVDTSVKSVVQAIRDLQQALAAPRTPGGGAGGRSALGTLGGVPLSEILSGAYFDSLIGPANDPAFQAGLDAAFRPGFTVPAFARGGTMRAGGSGGTDSQLMAMRMTPGEVATVTYGDTLGALADNLGKLADAVAAQGEQVAAVARAQEAQERFFRRVSDGSALRTVAA
jgi:hypothetical protein